jgi:hypothetical protein
VSPIEAVRSVHYGAGEVVPVVVDGYVVFGTPVTVTVLVLVLVDGGGTATVVVTVLMLVVVVVDEDVGADAAITPQANRLLDSLVGLLPKLSAVWWMTNAVPELFLRSAAVNKLVVVTSLAEPSERTCSAVRSPLAG